jgi:hypothetical protein
MIYLVKHSIRALLTVTVIAIIIPSYEAQAQDTIDQVQQDQSSIQADSEFLNLFEPLTTEEYSGYDKPHRTVEELAHWLSGVIMDSLDIEYVTSREDVQKSRAHFSNPSYRQYLDFLSKQSYWLFISQRKFNMNAASRRLPALLCKQSQNGLYTWVFEVPVIINLMETNQTPNISGKNAQEIVNLRIRLVRIPNMKITEANPHEVLIENWSLQDDTAILNNNIAGCM